MFIKLLGLILYSTLLLSESFADYKSSQNSEFKNFKAEFAKYKATIEAEFKGYKKELSKSWGKPILSSSKKWVEYSKDKKSRKIVDFEKSEVSIEVIAKDAKSAKSTLAKELIKTTIADTKTAHQNDELAQRVAKKLGKKQRVKAQPILAPLLLNGEKSIKELVKYAKGKINQSGITKSSSKIKGSKVYKIKIKLPSNSQQKLALNYKSEILKQAKRRELDPALVFAIMQTESNFNPRARSHIPAFGLMQIVPRSAGVDSYQYLHKKKRILSPSYLYDGDNNIEIGTTYLHILMTRYLKGVKDYKSRLYCSIAGYNTGAGNVSKAFRNDYNIYKAYPKINSMSSEQVYRHLVRNLKHKEARDYLKRVRERMKNYK